MTLNLGETDNKEIWYMNYHMVLKLKSFNYKNKGAGRANKLKIVRITCHLIQKAITI